MSENASEGGSEGYTQVGKCPACRVDNMKLRDVGGIFICEKCSSKRFSNKVRKSIQEAYEKQEDIKRRDAWKKRLETARRGVRLFDEQKHAEALVTFKQYITILENKYSVPPGQLHIGLFDPKKDAGEILLVSGVYWDMAKIYDHMKGHGSNVRKTLSKFIEFSVDRPHIIVASEAIRKYTKSTQCNNKTDFSKAHEVLLSHLARCFIASAVYGPTSVEVKTLQEFRDQSLQKTKVGRVLIALYYQTSPVIARGIIRSTTLTRIVRALLTPVIRITRIKNRN